jgi:hypothetical protein
MTIQALVFNVTGSVLAWGSTEFVAGPGQSVASVTDQSSFPEGQENRYVKVVSGRFVAMTPAERVAVDLALPFRRSHRVRRNSDVMVATGESSPGGGWGDFIPLTTTLPLLRGSYQVTCGFELALVGGPAVTGRAQARLEIDGVEVATWQTPRAPYHRCEFADVIVMPTDMPHTLRLQLRRFGPGPGSAHARRGGIAIAPAAPIDMELA